MAVGDTYILDEKQGKTLNRIDTKTNWEAVNPVLAIGEMGIEKDGLSQNIKVGDGVTPWNSLQYMFNSSCPYEVGDILVTMNETDPALRWPGTTWEVFAQGRCLIGAGTGTDSRSESKTFTAGATGGEYNHVLTVGELASHSHTASSNSTGEHTHTFTRPQGDETWNNGSKNAWWGPKNNQTVTTSSNGNHSHTITVNSNGSSAAHNNIMPYLSVYYFKRTA